MRCRIAAPVRSSPTQKSASGPADCRRDRRCAQPPPPTDTVRRSRSLLSLRGQTEVPAEGALEGAKHPLGHPAEVPDNLVAILHVVRNAIRKNVIHRRIRRPEPML